MRERQDTRLLVMSFNVRTDDEANGTFGWLGRKRLAVDVIREHHADLIGLQEGSAEQWREISDGLAGYSRFGAEQSDESDERGGFFRTNRFATTESGMFWLSDTPTVPYSISWGNDWGPRGCVWVRLRDQVVERELVFACTHVDTNADSWVRSARVLHHELDRVARGNPLVLVGDFNCAAGSDAHRYLIGQAGFRDAWLESGRSDLDALTFHAFTGITQLPHDAETLDEWLARTSGGTDAFEHYKAHVVACGNYRIDWILFRGPMSAVSASVDVRREGGIYPSDHYPVVALLEWEPR